MSYLNSSAVHSCIHDGGYSSTNKKTRGEKTVPQPCLDCFAVEVQRIRHEYPHGNTCAHWQRLWGKIGDGSDNTKRDSQFYSLWCLITQLYPNLDSVDANKNQVIVRRVNSQLQLEGSPVFGKDGIVDEEDLDASTKMYVTRMVRNQVQQYQRQSSIGSLEDPGKAKIRDAIRVDIHKQQRGVPKLVDHRRRNGVPKVQINPGGNFL
ncbi:hypothetical protein BJ170DRAFT_599307 [Xylariales sp. AK1849]|nr:hypothetical protein BJ170DRAFT_599307 [Xylariales sp. AK1849]